MNHCRFDAIISSKGMTYKIASGMLDQLLFHLPGLNECQLRGASDCFKLELTKSGKDFSWFTKSTVSRYSFSDYRSLIMKNSSLTVKLQITEYHVHFSASYVLYLLLSG